MDRTFVAMTAQSKKSNRFGVQTGRIVHGAQQRDVY